ncbi:MAG TPA: PQQ-binding-like beta-propeller repeat protein [Gemmatimonadaceae bacterium]|jgi:alcohol dehydrogenase (cytochrome c)|nr:PQQ-binding-like beta-propeller repeat protein [Gemmatimonadaceae bacterium]
MRDLILNVSSLVRAGICAAITITAGGCGETRGAPISVARVEDASWPTYNGTLDGERFANVGQITPDNVAHLGPACQIALGENGTFQSGPIVIGDTLFVTTPHSTAALDATTCDVLWRHIDTAKGPDVYAVNRGAAYLDGRVFRGTPDGRLLALDSRTGNTIWDVTVGDPRNGEFTSSAPIAWHGLVYIGLAGGDWGIRGRMMAFDAASGKERWRFNTVPFVGEPGAETWKSVESASRGGGAQWTSYTLDTASGELFVPVGNPAPDFAPQARPGDNLYTDAIIVLDANSGALQWYYQVVPHDGFDYDLAAAPALFNLDGPRVALGGKDGALYVVDRKSRQRLFKTAITTVTPPASPPTEAGVYACPGSLGGVEWNGPAYDPLTNLLYVGAVDWCGTYTTGTDSEISHHMPGDTYYGTNAAPVSTNAASGWLTAVDARSGAVKWRFHAPGPIVAGVTPTAGGVVFNGDLAGNFYAFDAGSGAMLYTYHTGGAIAGGVITYAIRGLQYVATTSGNVSRATFRTGGPSTLIIFSLNPPSRPRKIKLPAFKRPVTPNARGQTR